MATLLTQSVKMSKLFTNTVASMGSTQSQPRPSFLSVLLRTLSAFSA